MGIHHGGRLVLAGIAALHIAFGFWAIAGVTLLGVAVLERLPPGRKPASEHRRGNEWISLFAEGATLCALTFTVRGDLPTLWLALAGVGTAYADLGRFASGAAGAEAAAEGAMERLWALAAVCGLSAWWRGGPWALYPVRGFLALSFGVWFVGILREHQRREVIYRAGETRQIVR